jgi:glycosyltransferase involved in cell wall biosynthesis
LNFSLIIPTKDRKEILQETLQKVSAASNIEQLEVIIINDSDKPLVLDKPFPFASIYKNERGKGVASARNFGASKARHDWIIFMDDDMWVQRDTFEKLEGVATDEYRCINANWVYPEFLIHQLPRNPFLRYLRRYGFDSLEGWSSDVQWDKEKLFRVKGITSQFLLMHKKAFQKAGGYDVSFPFAGFEDHDLSRRLREKDIAVYVDPNNTIYHNEADRLEIEPWLERKKRGAITRRVAVSLGHKDLLLHYPAWKRFFYSMLYGIRKPLIGLLNNWPKKQSLDFLFSRLVTILLGAYSFKGYTGKEADAFLQKLN